MDMIENQGVAKIEEIRLLSVVALTGDVFNLPTSHVYVFQSGIILTTVPHIINRILNDAYGSSTTTHK